MAGSIKLQDKVIAAANDWVSRARLSLTFDFRRKPEGTDIRIDFMAGRGSWSYLGTMCRSIAPNAPTMNYGWLHDSSTEHEIRRVVLHEFGHALGLIHEHQNPKQPIHWNRKNVIEDLSGPPNNWDAATIENNMFRRYAPDQVTATNLDPRSIMLYPIPALWTEDGFSSAMNDDLSELDIELARAAYA